MFSKIKVMSAERKRFVLTARIQRKHIAYTSPAKRHGNPDHTADTESTHNEMQLREGCMTP